MRFVQFFLTWDSNWISTDVGETSFIFISFDCLALLKYVIEVCSKSIKSDSSTRY